MNVRIYKLGTRPDLRDVIDGDPDVGAFMFHGATDEFYLVRRPVARHGGTLQRAVDHEILHLILNRIGERRASRLLDRVSNLDDWLRHGCIGGL